MAIWASSQLGQRHRLEVDQKSLELTMLATLSLLFSLELTGHAKPSTYNIWTRGHIA